MKRELIAAAILLALIGGAYCSIRRTDALTRQVITLLEISEAAVEQGSLSQALSAASDAFSLWRKAEGFSHIFMRQAELDSTADVFFDLFSAIEEEQTDALPHLYAKLRYHLEGIADTEHIGLGSVL